MYIENEIDLIGVGVGQDQSRQTVYKCAKKVIFHSLHWNRNLSSSQSVCCIIVLCATVNSHIREPIISIQSKIYVNYFFLFFIVFSVCFSHAASKRISRCKYRRNKQPKKHQMNEMKTHKWIIIRFLCKWLRRMRYRLAMSSRNEKKTRLKKT